MREGDESRRIESFAPALILLTLSFVINYIDRGNISVAGPLIKSEFHLSDGQLGILFSAFFSTYTGMQFVAGWLVDRFDASRILAAGFLLWSLATAMTGVVRGFVLLLGMRFVLGIGEAVALPSGSKILSEHWPDDQRGFASGVAMSGLKWGNVIGTLGAGLLIAELGWRRVFAGVGLLSLLWLPAWRKWMPRGGKKRAGGSRGPRFRQILRQRSFWGTSAGHFAANYLLYFQLTWLPTYLVRERHLSIRSMAWVGGLCYAVDALSTISTGWLEDSLIHRGYTPTRVRKSSMVIGLVTAAAGLVGGSLAGDSSYVPWLAAAGFGCGMTMPGLYTFPQTLAGPHAVGKWYGWQNGFANFAGIAGPALTGFVLDATGKFFAPFAITAAICLGGALAWVFAVGRVEPVDWGPGVESRVLGRVPG